MDAFRAVKLHLHYILWIEYVTRTKLKCVTRTTLQMLLFDSNTSLTFLFRQSVLKRCKSTCLTSWPDKMFRLERNELLECQFSMQSGIVL